MLSSQEGWRLTHSESKDPLREANGRAVKLGRPPSFDDGAGREPQRGPGSGRVGHLGAPGFRRSTQPMNDRTMHNCALSREPRQGPTPIVSDCEVNTP
jgi:hypothetical protein